QVFGGAYVRAELRRALLIGAAVRQAMAREFVALLDDTAHELRIAFGDPAERKECRLDSGAGEFLEQTIGIALDAARQSGPIGAIDGARKRLDVEIVLDVDRHRIRDFRARGATHRLSPRRARLEIRRSNHTIARPLFYGFAGTEDTAISIA